MHYALGMGSASALDGSCNLANVDLSISIMHTAAFRSSTVSFTMSGHAHADLRTAAEAQAIHDAGLSFCRLHLMLTRLAIRQEDSSLSFC